MTPDAVGGRPRAAETLLVALGGAIGTGGRVLLDAAIPAAAGIPFGIFAVNTLGALLLGCLLESLDRSRLAARVRRRLRVFAGTGAIGGFTTYSALALDTATMLAASHVAAAVLYSLGSVVLGVLAAAAGMRMAQRMPRGGRS